MEPEELRGGEKRTQKQIQGLRNHNVKNLEIGKVLVIED